MLSTSDPIGKAGGGGGGGGGAVRLATNCYPLGGLTTALQLGMLSLPFGARPLQAKMVATN